MFMPYPLNLAVRPSDLARRSILLVDVFYNVGRLRNPATAASGGRLVIAGELSTGLEATVGIEPTMKVLQTSALPLGYVALSGFIAQSKAGFGRPPSDPG
jgi:hypothetical protein